MKTWPCLIEGVKEKRIMGKEISDRNKEFLRSFVELVDKLEAEKNYSGILELLEERYPDESTGIGCYILGITYDRMEYRVPENDRELIRKRTKECFEKAITFDDVPALSFRELARCYSKNNKEDLLSKEKILLAGLEKYPADSAISNELACFYLQEDSVEKALEVVKATLEKSPDNSPGLFLCYRCYNKIGNFSSALDCIVRIPGGHIESAIRFQILGDLYHKLNKFDDSIKNYEQILSCEKEDKFMALFCLARAFLGKKDYVKAAKMFADGMNHLKNRDVEIFDCNPIRVDGELELYEEWNCLDEVCKVILEIPKDQKISDEILSEAYYLASGRPESESFNYSYLEKAMSTCLKKSHLLKHGDYSCQNGKVLDGINSYFEYEVWRKRYNQLDYVESMLGYYINKEALKKGEFGKLDKWFKQKIKEYGKDSPEYFVLASYIYSFWAEMKRDRKAYKDVVKIGDLLKDYFIDVNSSCWFEFAYALNELRDYERSEAAYNIYLRFNPNSSGALNNLANLLKRKGQVADAIKLYEQALKIEPGDKIALDNLANAKQQLQNEVARIEAKKEEERKKTDFLKTAPERWDRVDYYKKKLLITLTKINSFNGYDELAQLSGLDSQYIRGHYKKLLELGMVIENKGENGKNLFQINPEILPLVEREKSHSVAIHIIKAKDDIKFRPIFSSRMEYQIYNLLIGLFPNHLVLPNMSLQTIFDYERMREALDNDLFQFYLLGRVDFCVVSTANYLPIIGYETDSQYHDSKEQKIRDEKKNKIFEIGGVYLLRMRFFGKPSLDEIRSRIIEDTQKLGLSMDPLEANKKGLIDLRKELNLEKFGSETVQ